MSLWQDVRFGARMLVKDKWFTVAAATALALGIGVNSMVFTIVNAVLIRSLPFRDPDRVVSITSRDSRDRGQAVSFLDFQDYARQARSFSHLGLIYSSVFSVSEEGRAPEQFNGPYIAANVFDVVGGQPLLGRSFRPEDDRPGAPTVVIIGNGMWKRRYGGDPGVLGKTIKLNGLVGTIVGVMPPDMQFPFNSELWLPYSQAPPGSRSPRRNIRNNIMFGRLADGITVVAAQAELSSIGAQLARTYPDTNKDIGPRVQTWQAFGTGDQVRLLFYALMGAVAFVLLIACANVANLLLARAVHRSKEVSVRAALGATRWRIVRQLLIESVLLAVLSGVLGLGVSLVGIRWFTASMPPGMPYWMTFDLDPLVFTFLAAISLATGVLFGLAPALQVSKTNVNEVLKEGGRSGSVGSRSRRWTGGLIIGELALTVVLLAGAGLMMRSFLAQYYLDIGVDTSQLMTFRISLPERQYPTQADRNRFTDRADELLGNMRGIDAGTTTSFSPNAGGMRQQLEVNGRVVPAGEQRPTVTMLTIGPRYFDTINVRLTRGRLMNAIDGTPGHENVIVNQRFADVHFPGADPLGKIIRLTEDIPAGTATAWMSIVGVAPNIRQRADFEDPAKNILPDPVVYLPTWANPNTGHYTVLMVRNRAGLAETTAIVRDQIRSIDAENALWDVRTVDDQLALQRWPQRVFGALFALFAAIALVLSAVGLYAVTSYSVTQRTQEIGIRMALGAQAKQVWWLIGRRTVVHLCIGLAIGLAGAFGVGRLLGSVTFLQIGMIDPLTLAVIAGILIVVSLLACFWPARRATRLDPTIALRYE